MTSFPVAQFGVHSAAVINRFLAKVRIVDDEASCWLWTGSLNHGGYGCAFIGRARIMAHRLSWEVSNGSVVPGGMLVLHGCDNPRCVRPSHLRTGTPADNMQDMVERGRNRAPRLHGSSNGSAKLNEDDARSIVALDDAGVSQADIAARFNIAASNVSFIVTGARWSSATGRVYVRRLGAYHRKAA